MSPLPRFKSNAVLLICLLVTAIAYADAPELRRPDWAGIAPPAPELNAFAAVLLDVSTQTVLYEHNADVALPPASLTKLVAIDVALRAVRTGEVSLYESFAPAEAAWAENQPTGSSLMFLGDGQRVTLEELLFGLSVSSGNDAAVALAHRLDGSVARFADRMNDAMALLGLDQLFFVEPSGLSPQNTITAHQFARFLLAHIDEDPELLGELYAAESYTYPGEWNRIAEWAQTPITQRNRNGLLSSYPGADGLKTGFIDESGYHLAATAERDGRRLIALVLGVNAYSHEEGARLREADAAALLDYGYTHFDHFSFRPPEGSPIPVYRGSQRYAVPRPDVITVCIPSAALSDLRGSSHVEYDAIEAPIAAGAIVGRAVVAIGDQVIGEAPIRVDEVGRGTWIRRGWDSIRVLFRSIGGNERPVPGWSLPLHP
jgi:D-alanyl-D-alanine carboxypeptidase (penicillin-binding protein 5/6)